MFNVNMCQSKNVTMQRCKNPKMKIKDEKVKNASQGASVKQ